MKRKTIAEIKWMLTEQGLSEPNLTSLRQDSRKGVQRLLDTYDRKQVKKQELHERQEMKRRFDMQYVKDDLLLAGVDEAGRGPLAGPVTAAAVILPEGFSLQGMTDSKQLTETERNKFYEIIRNEAIAFHIAVIEPDVIDHINIYEATKRAMLEALHALRPSPSMALIDAVKLSEAKMPTKSVVKGDDLSLAIGAASILAKVKRDEMMSVLDAGFPAYEFMKNKGYGTRAHLNALKEYGPTPYHRRSFAPVANVSQHWEEKWI